MIDKKVAGEDILQMILFGVDEFRLARASSEHKSKSLLGSYRPRSPLMTSSLHILTHNYWVSCQASQYNSIVPFYASGNQVSVLLCLLLFLSKYYQTKCSSNDTNFGPYFFPSMSHVIAGVPLANRFNKKSIVSSFNISAIGKQIEI